MRCYIRRARALVGAILQNIDYKNNALDKPNKV